MSRREITRRFDAIVEFSGVEKFLDTPVKRYSSGMYVRLAFAVAANLEPEILLVDEVLAVGDATFQKKCLGKMRGIAKESGRTILFVSHNMAAVRNLCSRLIVIRNGQVAWDGEVEQGIRDYIHSTSGSENQDDHSGPPGRLIRKIRIVDRHGRQTATLPTGEPTCVEIDVHPGNALSDVQLGFRVLTPDGSRILNFGTHTQYGSIINISEPTTFRCRLPSLPLAPGEFFLTVAIASSHRLLEECESALKIQMVESNYFGTGRIYTAATAPVVVPCEWTVGEESVQ